MKQAFIYKRGRLPMKRNYKLEEELMQLRNPLTNEQNFRNGLVKVGEYLGLEIAEILCHSNKDTKTSMGEYARHEVVNDDIAIIAVLRAGFPLYQGLLNVYANAESGFIGARRDEETLQSKITYSALPSLYKKSVIIADTMLATGGTMCDIIDEVNKDEPRQVILASAIASNAGIERVKHHSISKGYAPLRIYAAAIDPTLSEKGYILPGLGDAGDRCYGKTQ